MLPEKRKTRHGKELTLVLDLDETLVHCTVDPIVNPDHRFEVHFNGEEFQVFFCIVLVVFGDRDVDLTPGVLLAGLVFSHVSYVHLLKLADVVSYRAWHYVMLLAQCC